MTTEATIRDGGRGPDGVSPGVAPGRALRVVLLVAAMFAVLFQGVLLRSHTHLPLLAAPGVHGSTAHLVVVAAEDRSAQQDEADCPICGAMAHDGAFLVPDGPVLRIPEPNGIWREPALRTVTVRDDPSHAWRSRAPPQFFQA